MKSSPFASSYEGKERKLGVEIEFAGLDINQIAEILTSEIGGKATFRSKFECVISGSALGEFGDVKIELDAALLKGGKLPKYLNMIGIEKEKYTDSIEDFLSKAAMEVVPMEVVTPPVPLSQIVLVEQIREVLRINAAKGTSSSVFHAFGLHLNPEVPSLEAVELRDFLRAYIIMHNWLLDKMDIDKTRRVTPFITPFPKDYARHILHSGYHPDIKTLIDDYLQFNPTRNRPLDMLPLFTFIDKERVTSKITDGLTTSRPTFHYRLPNCDISNPEWTITREWNYWVTIERVAHSKDKLEKLSMEYLDWLDNPAKRFFRVLGNKIEKFIS